MVSILLIKEPISVFFEKKSNMVIPKIWTCIQNLFKIFFRFFFLRAKMNDYFCIYAYIANIHLYIHTNLNSEKRHGKLFSPILI